MVSNELRQKASPPFDGSFVPPPDIILRTADNVDFYAHRGHLAIASSMFRDMFVVPQPAEAPDQDDRGPDTGVPIIPVTEHSTCWNAVLRWIYPVEDPSPTMTLAAEALTAAVKYDIPYVVASTETWLSSHCSTDPMRLYATACRYGREKLEAAAMRNGPDCFRYVSEMDILNAGQLYRLLEHVTSRKRGSNGSHSVPGPPHASTRSGPSCDIPAFTFVPASHPMPDAVLRSKDGFEFYVNKAFLMFSPTLAALLDGRNATERLPVIDMEEDAHTLHALIQLCTPASDPQAEGLLQTRDLLQATLKYSFPRAIDFAKRRWAHEARFDPYVAYFIAIKLSWHAEARVAAAASLSIGDPLYDSEMEDAPARSLYELLRFRITCEMLIIERGYYSCVAIVKKRSCSDWNILELTPCCRFDARQMHGCPLPHLDTSPPNLCDPDELVFVSVVEAHYWKHNNTGCWEYQVNGYDGYESRFNGILEESRAFKTEIDKALMAINLE